MGPAAILSVLVNADTQSAAAKLSRFDSQMKTVRHEAEKGIETRLGGTFDDRAFREYQRAAERTARVTADRKAFRAQLGADFSMAGFRAYERSIDRASREAARMAGDQEAAANRVVRAWERMRGAAGKGMGKEETSFARGAEKSLVGRGTSMIGGALAGGLAGFASTEAIKSSIEGTTTLVRQAQILAHYTGMSTQSAMQFQSVANAYGVGSKSLGMGFRTLSTAMNTALIEPTKKNTAAFRELGISHDQVKAHAKDLGGMFGLVADRLNKVPAGAERTALASKLLGRNWQALAPLLMQGSKGMQAQLEDAKALGVTLSGNPLKAVGQLHEAEVRLKIAQEGLSVQFTEHIAPALIKVTEGAIKVAEAVGRQMAPTFHQIMPVLREVWHWIEQNRKVVIGLAIAFAGFKIFSVVTQFAKANPYFLAFALLAGIIIKNWKTIGPFLANLWKSIKAAAAPVIQWLGNAWRNVTHAIGVVWKALWPGIHRVIQVTFASIKVELALLKGAFDFVWNLIKPLVLGVIDAIRSHVQHVFIPAFQWVMGAVKDLWPVFKTVFGAIKDVVGGTINFVLGILSTFLSTVADVAGVLKHLPGGHALFGGVASDAQNAANAINGLRDAIKGVPATKTVKVVTAADYGALILGAPHAATAARHATRPTVRHAARIAATPSMDTAGAGAAVATLPASTTRAARATMRYYHHHPVGAMTAADWQAWQAANAAATATATPSAAAVTRAATTPAVRATMRYYRHKPVGVMTEAQWQAWQAARAATTTTRGTGTTSTANAAGSFDLMPGNIRLPTFYDVRHRPPHVANQAGHHITNHIHIRVEHDVDVRKVTDVLDRAIPGVRARLRASGVST